MTQTSPAIVYGIGAAKSGTTWLYEMFRRHPAIGVPSLKECQYWDWKRAPHFANPLIHRRLGQYELPGFQARTAGMGLVSAKAREANSRYRFYERMYGSGYYDHSAYLEYLRSENPGKELLADISPGYALLSAGTF